MYATGFLTPFAFASGRHAAYTIRNGANISVTKLLFGDLIFQENRAELLPK